ncbi:hypothetical protein BGZ83_005068 [Gryganskiella cystojenkinii]|nr:hypothetical protein BGZ83_005068 [Gryganskiella cystojenkinii]
MDSAHAHSSKQTRFVQWLTDNNAHFPKLEFRDDVEGCGSVYAKEDIAEDEVFLILPTSPLVITDALARKNLEQLAPISTPKLDSRTVLTLFLVQQLQAGEESFFQPYLAMIPSRIHTALEFDDHDLEWVRGTNAFLTVQDLKQTLRARYDDTMELISKEGTMDPNIFTWERFLWAETVISSRTFPAHLFGSEIEGELALIPLGDTLNHKSRHKATWIKTPQGLEMASSAVKKGEQLYNNYGPKSNEELLVGYGFCIAGNEDDTVTIKANFSRDPDQERKTMILKHIGIKSTTMHYLRPGYIPHQLLATMRVMAMNPVEVDICYGLADQEETKLKDPSALTSGTTTTTAPITTVANALEFLSVRNELAMLDLLDMLMRTKLQGILEWDVRLSLPQNQAQEFAQIYREGQKQILDSCLDLSRGMMSKLLQEAVSGLLDLKTAMFMNMSDSTTSSSQRLLPMDDYTPDYFKECAARETKTMSGLKQEVVSQLLLTARGVMLEHRDEVFGEAFMAAFPDHGWGESEKDENSDLGEEDEMAIQMEQDAILTCFLVQQSHSPSQRSRFIEAAKTVDYSSQLDEDMLDDVEDLRQSLQGTLESVDGEVFDFENKFTSEVFVWATGILEALSVSLHINGEQVTGILAPKDTTSAMANRLGKRKLESQGEDNNNGDFQ